MRLYRYSQEQITGRAAISASISLTAQADSLSIIDTCGDINAYGLLDSQSAVALTFSAGVLDDFTLTAAVGTGLSGGDHAERTAGSYLNASSALTVGAYLGC